MLLDLDVVDPPGASWEADLKRTISQAGKINHIEVEKRLAAVQPANPHPALTAPDGSVTVPVSSPVSTCPGAWMGAPMAMPIVTNTIFASNCLMGEPLVRSLREGYGSYLYRRCEQSLLQIDRSQIPCDELIVGADGLYPTCDAGRKEGSWVRA